MADNTPNIFIRLARWLFPSSNSEQGEELTRRLLAEDAERSIQEDRFRYGYSTSVMSAAPPEEVLVPYVRTTNVGVIEAASIINYVSADWTAGEFGEIGINIGENRVMNYYKEYMSRFDVRSVAYPLSESDFRLYYDRLINTPEAMLTVGEIAGTISQENRARMSDSAKEFYEPIENLFADVPVAILWRMSKSYCEGVYFFERAFGYNMEGGYGLLGEAAYVVGNVLGMYLYLYHYEDFEGLDIRGSNTPYINILIEKLTYPDILGQILGSETFRTGDPYYMEDLHRNTAYTIRKLARVDREYFSVTKPLRDFGKPSIDPNTLPEEDQIAYYKEKIAIYFKLKDDHVFESLEKELEYYKQAAEYSKTLNTKHLNMYEVYKERKRLLGEELVSERSPEFLRYYEEIEISERVESFVVGMKADYVGGLKLSDSAKNTYIACQNTVQEREDSLDDYLRNTMPRALTMYLAEIDANQALIESLKGSKEIITESVKLANKRFKNTIQAINNDPDGNWYITNGHTAGEYRAVIREPLTIGACQRGDTVSTEELIGYGLTFIEFTQHRIKRVVFGGIHEYYADITDASHPHKEIADSPYFCTGNVAALMKNGLRGRAIELGKALYDRPPSDLSRVLCHSTDAGFDTTDIVKANGVIKKRMTKDERIELLSWFVGINDIAKYLDGAYSLLKHVDYTSPYMRPSHSKIRDVIENCDEEYEGDSDTSWEGVYEETESCLDKNLLKELLTQYPDKVGVWKEYTETVCMQVKQENRNILEVIAELGS